MGDRRALGEVPSGGAIGAGAFSRRKNMCSDSMFIYQSGRGLVAPRRVYAPEGDGYSSTGRHALRLYQSAEGVGSAGVAPASCTCCFFHVATWSHSPAGLTRESYVLAPHG